MENEVRVRAEKLKNYCEQILIAASIREEEAKVIADNLVDANIMGVDSHGVTRLADYLARLEEGKIKLTTDITIEKETNATALFNANNGWGHYAGKVAMDYAIKKAKEHGVAFVGVKNSNHYGTASYFTRMAATEQCLGISMSNASPLMVPWGAKKPTLGTNPLAIAVPTNTHPVILDMATSTVARGKINLAAKNNEPIPKSWAITKEGEQTTDPHEALKGFLLPFGAKGSGLAMMIDIMTGVMTGAMFGEEVPRMYDDPEPQQLGHVFIVCNIESFMDIDEFKARMDRRIQQTVDSPPSEGFDQVFMPGDLEQMTRLNRLSEGIPLSKAIYNELASLGKKYGVEMGNIIQK